MSQRTQSAGPVTAADVRASRFPLVKRGGYDPKEVDPFLEIIAQTLEGGPLADPSIDAAYIHRIRFTTVRRSGYEATKVDALLDRIIDTLDPMNGEATPDPAVARAGDATPDPAVARAKPVVRNDRVSPANGTAGQPRRAAPPAADEPLTPMQEGQAHLDRLRTLHAAGVLSDKEVAVIAQRVKRRAKAQMAEAEAEAATPRTAGVS